jgi:hypothetical protein
VQRSRREDLAAQLAERGVCALVGEEFPREPNFDRFALEWNMLPPDPYLEPEHCRRNRRYARLKAVRNGDGYTSHRLADAPFTQTREIIPLHHGRARHFMPATPALLGATLGDLVQFDLDVMSLALRPIASSFVGAHFMRVWASPGKDTSPAPEGRHRDGHDFVAMHLIRRHGCCGARSMVYAQATSEPAFETELEKPLDALIVNDRAMEHEVGPLTATGAGGYRDMLIVDFEDIVFSQT